MISIVVAMDANGLIGSQGKMPWHCPADLHHFRNLTLGHTVLMGRKTFSSIGFVLPERRSIVVTRDHGFQIKDERVEVHHDLHPLLHEWQKQEEVLFVAGGAEIYKEALPFAEELWISYIQGTYTGDTYFPIVSLSEFQEEKRWEKEGFTLVLYRRFHR